MDKLADHLFLISETLLRHPNLPPETAAFAKDLVSLLIRKKLRNYEGVKALSHAKPVLPPSETLFFDASSTSFRGFFIGFEHLLRKEKSVEEAPAWVFWKPEAHFSNASMSDFG